MREYGLIFSHFWINPGIQSLSDDAKLLALYLLTCSHTNMLGCFRLPTGYVAEDLRWGFERVQQGFKELLRIEFVIRDEPTGWLVIPHFLKWNPIENPNQGKSISKLFQHIPPHSTVYQPLIRALIEHGKHLDEPFLNRLQTLAQPLLNQDQEQEQDQDQDQEQKQEQNQEQENSAEPTAAATVAATVTPLVEQPVVMTLPLNDQREFPITPSQLTEWQALYPAIDVLQTLRHIRGWNLANPQKRKTQRGILKHITHWLAKEQDRHASRRAPPAGNNANLYAYNQAIGDEWLQETTNHINPTQESTRP